jgi:hypothetical protein
MRHKDAMYAFGKHLGLAFQVGGLWDGFYIGLVARDCYEPCSHVESTLQFDGGHADSHSIFHSIVQTTSCGVLGLVVERSLPASSSQSPHASRSCSCAATLRDLFCNQSPCAHCNPTPCAQILTVTRLDSSRRLTSCRRLLMTSWTLPRLLNS